MIWNLRPSVDYFTVVPMNPFCGYNTIAVFDDASVAVKFAKKMIRFHRCHSMVVRVTPVACSYEFDEGFVYCLPSPY